MTSRLIDATFTKNGIRLLKLFFYTPAEELHQAEVIRRSGLSRGTVTRLLRKFYREGILKTDEKGDLAFYSIVAWHPFVRQLKVALNVAEIYDLVKGLTGKEIFLYGPAARGEDTSEDEIDLLIITSMPRQEILKELDKARRKTGRKINAAIYTPAEYAYLPDTDKRFYENLQKEMIILLS